MEQKEKKQKSQAAENQASCPPQQPASPHPFISVIPLAVLIALIVLVVKLFPDDALAGASQVALMIATAVCVALGMGIYRMKWNIFEEMIKKLLQHHQSFDELSGCHSGLRTQPTTQGKQSICSRRV